MRCTALLTAFLLFNLNLLAQIPELTSSDKTTPISLQKLEVAVKIIGTRSSTTFTMTFYNPTDKILEGTFLLPLPNGANVTRYALDINGMMREAVPVEKIKATQVFESVEKRRIDPGLLEKTEGNVFRTRIYPLPAHGQRSIIIGYEQELTLSKNNELSYYLPFQKKDTIGRFSLSIDVQQRDNAPVLESAPIKDLKFFLQNGHYCTNEEKENIQLSVPLSIRMTRVSTDVQSFVQKRNGEYFFFLQSFIPSSTRDKKLPKNLVVVWDNSLSGIYRNTHKEKELLLAYLNRLGTATVKLYTLSNSFQLAGTFSVQNGRSRELETKLNNLNYDGGTDYSEIKADQTDEMILFSDGLSTLSDRTKLSATSPVYTISSSSKADYGALKAIAEESGGAFIDLQSRSLEDALQTLSKQTLQFLGIKRSVVVKENYPNTPASVQNGFSMAGKLGTPATTITLQFGYGKRVAFEKNVQLEYVEYETEEWDLSKLFAQKKIEELDKNYEKNKEEILALGKQYSIITRNTSLLVLEDVMDYVRHEIEPPLELRSEYKRLLKEKMDERSESRQDVLENALGYSEELQEWWNTSYPIKETSTTRFTPPKIVPDTAIAYQNADGIASAPLPPVAERNEVREVQLQNFEPAKEEETTVRRSLSSVIVSAESVVVNAYSNALQGKVSGVSVTPQGALSTNNSMVIVDGVITTVMPPKEKVKSMESLAPAAGVALYGSRAANGVIIISTKEKDDNEDEPQIKLEEKTSSAIYLKTVAKAPRSQQYKTYLELRDKNLLNPTFYHDMAGFFLKQNRALGMQILTNLGELDFENHELYKLFAFKLKELGEKDMALYVFKKILLWRPQEPQSYRDYALALADKGKYQAALDTLYLALTKEYDENVMENFNGIEETIVTELNGLITKYKTLLNITAIDKKLIHSMPVDIRVVLSWNMNDTDIDLWVTDPNGEKCFYSNNKTKIGGRMSEDFTNGYGPEQFLLKKAVKGKYKIQVHYYGENSAKIAGKTTLLAEVFTNYGRANEQRKLITLQLEGEEEREGVYVGEFAF
jgi:TonB-dependent SusC/RagA subfamily outer membrane receptor